MALEITRHQTNSVHSSCKTKIEPKLLEKKKIIRENLLIVTMEEGGKVMVYILGGGGHDKFVGNSSKKSVDRGIRSTLISSFHSTKRLMKTISSS